MRRQDCTVRYAPRVENQHSRPPHPSVELRATNDTLERLLVFLVAPGPHPGPTGLSCMQPASRRPAPPIPTELRLPASRTREGAVRPLRMNGASIVKWCEAAVRPGCAGWPPSRGAGAGARGERPGVGGTMEARVETHLLAARQAKRHLKAPHDGPRVGFEISRLLPLYYLRR